MPDREISRLVSEPPPRGTYRGTVSKAPVAVDDRLEVTIDEYSDSLPFDAAWQPRQEQPLPDVGDQCLVHLVGGEAWVSVWWPYGD